MEEKVRKAVDAYKTAIDLQLSKDPFMQIEVLQTIHNHELKKQEDIALQEIEESSFRESLKEELKKKLDGAFEDIKQAHIQKLQQYYDLEDNLIEEAKTQFLSLLKSSYWRKVKSGVELEEKCTEDLKLLNFMVSFNNTKNLYKKQSQESYELLRKVREELHKVLEALGSEVEIDRLKQMKSQDAPKEAKMICLSFYKFHFKKNLRKAKMGYLEEAQLQTCHETVFNESDRKFISLQMRCQTVEDALLWNEMEMELKRRLQLNLEQYKMENEKKRRAVIEKAEKFVTQCLDEYSKIMDNFLKKQLVREDSFNEEHLQGQQHALEMFQKLTKWGDPEFFADYLTNLKSELEDTRKDYYNLFETKVLDERAVVEGILAKCEKHYHDEMKTRWDGKVFMKPSKLKKSHKLAREYFLSRCKHRHPTPLSPFQENELELKVEALYNHYRDKNDLILNSCGPAPAIGIDLGTTYSCVAVYFNDRVIVIPCFNSSGEDTIPSYVALKKKDSGEWSETIGTSAKDEAYEDPPNTLYDIKRLIGRKFNDPFLQQNLRSAGWPFEIRDFNGVPKVGVFDGERYFAPEEISAKVLYQLKNMAEDHIGLKRDSIRKAVITVPANFIDGQRQATIHAGKLANLEDVTLLNEPTAAAIAYSLEGLRGNAEKVLVFDFGGGTFDVCIMNVRDREVDVLATKGDLNLGGQDIDRNLMEFCAREFKRINGGGAEYDIIAGMKQTSDRQLRGACMRSWGRLQLKVEGAKKVLSNGTETKIKLSSFCNGKDLEVTVSRKQFEEMNEKEFQKAITLLKQVMQEANVQVEEIDEIVLVGGSSRIPRVQDLLQTMFHGKALNKSIQPDHAVAYGAAVMAALKHAEQAKSKINFEQIHDVISMSLGVAVVKEGVQGCFSEIIKRFTKIPTKKTETGYSTLVADQTSMNIQIFQGDNPMVKDNELLGSFLLSGLTPGPAGQEKAEICMEIDDAGILHVTAKSVSDGHQESLSVTEFKSRLTDEDIQEILAEESTRRKLQSIREKIDKLGKNVEEFQGPCFTRKYKELQDRLTKFTEELTGLERNVNLFEDLQAHQRTSSRQISNYLNILRQKIHSDGQSCANCGVIVKL